MTQHTATNVLRVGNQMAIVVNMVLAGITCRLLCPHAQVVMVQEASNNIGRNTANSSCAAR